jgi:2-C-methyl-D-erythritol 4-phosphate cytidylyltransferase / 2-C-methyl-D-erythritol 2,4-cyclodiphosphate synthase
MSSPLILSPTANCAAIIVAAGSGARMGGDVPKQFMDLGGIPVLAHSFRAFANDPRFFKVVVVCSSDWMDKVRAITDVSGVSVITVVGGATRRESVRAGLDALRKSDNQPDYIFVHDAARPGLTQVMLDRLHATLRSADAAIPALSVVDSMATVADGVLAQSLDRSKMVKVQTPQAFRAETLFAAHERWIDPEEPNDDARMAQAIGARVAVITGYERLIKLTSPEDFALFHALHSHKGSSPTMRIGQGYDVHRLVEGEELWLCGVKIDHTHGLAGHSDADVALHAITDAVLGAIGEGDIGQHFPPSDPQWRGARSDQFLTHAMQLARDKGFILGNADVTIICERPKIGPHREAMRHQLAAILNVSVQQISVKATTTEGLGFTGREEGIAAQAVVLLQPI